MKVTCRKCRATTNALFCENAGLQKGAIYEAAYKVTGEHLRSEGDRRNVRLRVRKARKRPILLVTPVPLTQGA
jgi:hypothetical protein